MSVRELKPNSVWRFFADLNAVPRPSKHEGQVIDFMRGFGEGLGLDTSVDSVGNVLIRKPASAGMENRTPVAMQAHLDMVHQKNSETEFDFATQGIEMEVEGDWVRAKGTTLGADNGMGVAAIMAVLASDEVAHPPLEALFTIDEETGMTGAQGLQPGVLRSKVLLNLDTEEDNELTIGCAGGVDVTAVASYTPESGDDAPMAGRRIQVRGLRGGHSGVDIHLGRGNANQWMTRILWAISRECDLRIAEIDGGGLRNAIPRESVAWIATPADQTEKLGGVVERVTQELLDEHRSTDPDGAVTCQPAELPSSFAPAGLVRQLLATLYACPNGIHRMSPDIPDLVQTSNNLARVELGAGRLSIQCLTRSSVNSERDDLANALTALFEILGGEVKRSGAYPGWTPNPHASIVQLMADLHQELFASPANVLACHAGLECGILGRHYPEIEMVSFGPNIRGAHSPDERVQISSVQKFWRFLLETLQRIPAA